MKDGLWYVMFGYIMGIGFISSILLMIEGSIILGLILFCWHTHIVKGAVEQFTEIDEMTKAIEALEKIRYLLEELPRVIERERQ